MWKTSVEGPQLPSEKLDWNFQSNGIKITAVKGVAHLIREHS